tara:strand:- start:95 stop:976 length:882 start_codon:yes stop_codon:yes gene_type:complete
MNQDLVSVIMPTFQSGSLIGKAIQSVLSQTYQNIELIVVDNFSTDNTYEVVSSFDDTRVIYKKIQNEGIISKSRNLGIEISQGRWIAFLDSDDSWYQNKLEDCIRIANNYNAEFIYHKMKIISDRFRIRRTIGLSLDPKLSPLENLLFKGNLIPNSSVFVSKELILKVGPISEDSQVVTWEDFDFWIRSAKQSDKFFFINKVLGSYWLGEGNTSSPIRSIDNSIAIKERIFSNRHFPRWLEYQHAVALYKASRYDDSLKIFTNNILFSKNIDKITFKSMIIFILAFLGKLLKR